jgi:hypothetical protein
MRTKQYLGKNYTTTIAKYNMLYTVYRWIKKKFNYLMTAMQILPWATNNDEISQLDRVHGIRQRVDKYISST